MDSGILTLIIMSSLIGLFLLWRIPINRKTKREEDNFIAQHIDDYALLTFSGNTISIDALKLHWYRGKTTESHVENIVAHYGHIFALPPGEYDSMVSFYYNYGNGSKAGGTGYTKRIEKNLSLEKGCRYYYRLKEFSFVDKKLLYNTIFEETITSPNPMGTRHDMQHTIVFEQIINEH